jgi:hypothetical protein
MIKVVIKKSIIYQMYDAPTILFTESQLTLINMEDVMRKIKFAVLK